MSDARVTVIVPSYNGARFLEETLRSALDQTRPPHELLVVDDGSTDASPEIARALPGVTCIEQKNEGASAARNRAIRVATGDFLLFLDHDDRLRRDALEIGLAAFAAHPEAGFVYGKSESIDAEGRPLPAPIAPTHGASYATLLGGDSLVPPACALFRREAVLAVGGFRTAAGMTEDHDLYLRVARRGPVHCHNRVVVDYRIHETNACRGRIDGLLRSMMWTLDQQAIDAPLGAELEGVKEAGRRHWRGVFGPLLATQIVAKAKNGEVGGALADALLLARHHPKSFATIGGELFAKLARLSGVRR